MWPTSTSASRDAHSLARSAGAAPALSSGRSDHVSRASKHCQPLWLVARNSARAGGGTHSAAGQSLETPTTSAASVAAGGARSPSPFPLSTLCFNATSAILRARPPKRTSARARESERGRANAAPHCATPVLRRTRAGAYIQTGGTAHHTRCPLFAARTARTPVPRSPSAIVRSAFVRRARASQLCGNAFATNQRHTHNSKHLVIVEHSSAHAAQSCVLSTLSTVQVYLVFGIWYFQAV